MNDTPIVEIFPETMWCNKHLEPFGKTGPLSYIRSTKALLKAALEMPAVQDHAHRDANNLTASLKRFAPICCFVTLEALTAAYEAGAVKP